MNTALPAAALLSLVCCGLYACGGAGSGPAPAATSARAHTGGGGGDDMVEAVGSNLDATTLDLKFALGARPVAGQPLIIHVRMTPLVDLGRVEARMHADEGMELRPAIELAELDHPVHDVAVDREITAVPAHEGIYTIQVTVTTDGDAASVSRTYGIPVIVAPATASAPP